jgi:hypothetical protein
MAEVILPNAKFDYKTWAENENWSIQQNWTWHNAYEWVVEVRETFGIEENRWVNELDFHLAESLKVQDKYVNSITAHILQSLNVKDEYKFERTFIRNWKEAVKIAPSNQKHYSQQFRAGFKVFDSLLRSARGAISDILFEKGEWTLDSVRQAIAKGKHVGYENFKTFIYGDYVYQKALFRTTLDASGADRGVIEQCQIAVDVPDLVDRGSEELEDKNFDMKVYFNKNFHIAPEVNITIKAGTTDEVVVANVVEITEEYFTMYLKNAVTGERTTGRFIWTATGY